MCLSQPTAHTPVASGDKTMPYGYLENDVSWQQPSVSGNHSITINMLDDDVDQRGFTTSHEPDGEAFTGICSVDLDACNFTIWNQVIQPWEDWKRQKQYLFQTSIQWALASPLLAKLKGSSLLV